MIPEAAVEAAYDKYQHLGLNASDVEGILEVAAPHTLAAAVESAKTNHGHLAKGASDYSAGFHYALHCISPE